MNALARKTVGILGGMGQAATVDLMRRVIRGTPARDDADHIRMLVDSNPGVPSRIEALIGGTGESPVPCLVEMARGLERQGADFLVIPCNTAHHYHAEVAAAVDIPVLNLVEMTARGPAGCARTWRRKISRPGARSAWWSRARSCRWLLRDWARTCRFATRRTCWRGQSFARRLVTQPRAEAFRHRDGIVLRRSDGRFACVSPGRGASAQGNSRG